MDIKKSKSNIVLIGAGYWGTNIAKNLIKLKINKITVCDSNFLNSKILKKRFPKNIIINNNFKSLIRNKLYKYFIFATPPSKNYKLIYEALKYDKKIFLEKPGFKSLKELNNLKKKFPYKINNISFGYIYIFNNYIKYIKKFVNNKNNGKILYINFQRQNLGPIRNDVDVSYDLSSHDISILLYLFNHKLKLLSSYGYKILKKNISDISNLSFKIHDFYAHINNSWINPDKVRRIIIITSKKMLLFDEMKSVNKIKIFNKYAQYPKVNKLKNKFFFKSAKIYEGQNFEPKIYDNDPLFDEIKYFITSKNNNIIDYKFGSKVLGILNTI